MPDWSSHPLVLAPMAGGPSTVALAAAVAGEGVFPVLAGAYLSAQRLREDVRELRGRTDAPFGVNLFAPSPDDPARTRAARAYAVELAPWAAAAGVELGEPRWDDDDVDAKVEVLVAEPPAVVTFAFGWPRAVWVQRLQSAGAQVWLTVNEPGELEGAIRLGVDGLVAQGWEAGGHRGGPVDTDGAQPSVRDLLAVLRGRTHLPIMAAGGVMTGAEVADLLGRGARCVALGTAFLGCPEAGTSPVHAHELTARDATVVTRAFTGRRARALVTTWTELLSASAPAAYPHVHHLTAPLRAHGKATGEAELVHLWAGAGHERLRRLPAAELARALVEELGAAGHQAGSAENR